MNELIAGKLIIKPQAKPAVMTREKLITALIGLVCLIALVVGWLTRHEKFITPGYGLGYAIGITGGSMMLLLLVYPLRKRIKGLATWGSVGFWFRFHMCLGMFGPILILYHSRFSFGAMNSGVALTAMLIVAGSGIVGRFLYARVHRGYSGRKLEIRGVLSEVHEMIESLSSLDTLAQPLRELLEPFEARAVKAGGSFQQSAAAVFSLGFATRAAKRSANKLIADVPDVQRKQLHGLVNEYFEATRRAAEFAYYDRMLRLWHLLHIPLFVLLVCTAIIHIVAVHMY